MQSREARKKKQFMDTTKNGERRWTSRAMQRQEEQSGVSVECEGFRQDSLGQVGNRFVGPFQIACGERRRTLALGRRRRRFCCCCCFCCSRQDRLFFRLPLFVSIKHKIGGQNLNFESDVSGNRIASSLSVCVCLVCVSLLTSAPIWTFPPTAP